MVTCLWWHIFHDRDTYYIKITLDKIEIIKERMGLGLLVFKNLILFKINETQIHKRLFTDMLGTVLLNKHSDFEFSVKDYR